MCAIVLLDASPRSAALSQSGVVEFVDAVNRRSSAGPRVLPMSKSFAASCAAVVVLIAGPALADPASGLVPEQGPEPGAQPAPGVDKPACCSDGVTFTPEAAKDPGTVEPVRLVRTPFGAISSSLPEPASWALMIVGFGGMGAILRNHRRAMARP